MSIVVNMNTHPVSVRIKTPSGQPDYVTVAPRGRVRLPADTIVEPNWHAGEPNIKIVDEVQGE